MAPERRLRLLRLADGQEGRPCLIAYRGKVYDVGASWQWQRGVHQVRHLAGRDYGDDLQGAPHGADLFERLPVVGLLAQRPPRDD